MNAVISYFLTTLINKLISGVITALVVAIGIIIGVNIIKKAIPLWIDKIMEYQEKRNKHNIDIERMKWARNSMIIPPKLDDELIKMRKKDEW